MRTPAQVGMDRNAAIRDAFKARGLSEAAVQLIFARYKHGEKKGANKQHHVASLAQLVLEHKRSPLDFRSSAVVNCLASEITGQGLGVAMARKFLSMCSVTHELLHHDTAGYTALSTDPLIKKTLEGVKKHIAPTAKSTEYFSLTEIFDYLRMVSADDEKCPLDVLRDKCIVLMLIDGFARTSPPSIVTA